jgi:leader peptidase (prepilin peptidase)/N-methyltransferase
MDALLNLLQARPDIRIGVFFLLGLLVGSFLNVVILRLPPRLFHRWRAEARETLALPAATGKDAEPPPGIVRPPSRCRHCGQHLRPWHNIPLLSYLALRGRCGHCGAPISLRYPLVELFTALAFAIVAWRFEIGPAALGALIFTGLLIALSGIDLDHQILPDNLTLPGMWLGLVVNLGGTFTDPVTALIGAMAGYLSLWSVYQAFRLLTGKEGMGYGDFKLLALIGAWLGWTHLPGAILIGSLLGALIGSVALHVSGRNRQTPIPFGPFLAAGGWIMLIAGDFLNRGYLNLSGMA